MFAPQTHELCGIILIKDKVEAVVIEEKLSFKKPKRYF
jgi:hypothetical protein